MASQLKVSVGQFSDRGRKAINQDFHGVYTPREAQLSSKGIAIALADGISSSEVSQIASEAAVTGFLADYFSTPESWSVKKSAQRVLSATNSWLYAQTRQSRYRYDRDKGYVCTLSALVIKSTTAHLFHAGDARIYRLRGRSIEQLTEDHRFWVSSDTSYLSRALGMDSHLELDYQALSVEVGDAFLLVTDGVYEFAGDAGMLGLVQAHAGELDRAAQAIALQALENGSDDNLSVQIVRIDELPSREAGEIHQQLGELPLPPVLSAPQRFDGWRIIRDLHASSRSHVYLAEDEESGTRVVLKTPSMDLQHDPAYLERFLTEEWIARRIDNPHVLEACLPERKRNYLYSVFEYIEGQTLAQWIIDHPRPDLEQVRGIVEQIAKGLRALHRLEMLHQDLRPANLMIDASGTLKLIDFGSVRVAGILETASPLPRDELLGTAAYTAPEYFLGEGGTPRSDQFSLAVITYQLLCGRLPYGTRVAAATTRAAQNRLSYSPLGHDCEVPAWLDGVLRKALHPDPLKRFDDLSEFVVALRQPGRAILDKARAPLLERNPVAFWQGVSFGLAVLSGYLLLR